MITRHTRPLAPLPPEITDPPLLSDPGFILEPQLQALVGMALGDRRQRGRKPPFRIDGNDLGGREIIYCDDPLTHGAQGLHDAAIALIRNALDWDGESEYVDVRKIDLDDLYKAIRKAEGRAEQ